MRRTLAAESRRLRRERRGRCAALSVVGARAQCSAAPEVRRPFLISANVRHTMRSFRIARPLVGHCALFVFRRALGKQPRLLAATACTVPANASPRRGLSRRGDCPRFRSIALVEKPPLWQRFNARCPLPTFIVPPALGRILPEYLLRGAFVESARLFCSRLFFVPRCSSAQLRVWSSAALQENEQLCVVL